MMRSNPKKWAYGVRYEGFIRVLLYFNEIGLEMIISTSIFYALFIVIEEEKYL